jgi:hypothetical protein
MTDIEKVEKLVALMAFSKVECLDICTAVEKVFY